MHREHLLSLLDIYQDTWAAGRIPYETYDFEEESKNITELRNFVERQPKCLERSCVEGHITASALVTDPGCQKVLLTLHAKLGKWLQLGGHVDGEVDVQEAALREAQEESGQPAVKFFPYEALAALPNTFSPIPFDLDIHVIPARKDEPEHRHFDLRFLCRLDPEQPIVISEESKDLRWLTLSKAQKLTNERSMHRQFWKLIALRERFLSL